MAQQFLAFLGFPKLAEPIAIFDVVEPKGFELGLIPWCNTVFGYHYIIIKLTRATYRPEKRLSKTKE
jgi:hypothetical protein